MTPHVKLSLCVCRCCCFFNYFCFLTVPRHTRTEQQVHAVAEALALLPSLSISGTCAYQCSMHCGVFSPILQGTGEKKLHAKGVRTLVNKTVSGHMCSCQTSLPSKTSCWKMFLASIPRSYRELYGRTLIK